MAITANGITMTTTSDGGVTWRTTVAPPSWPNTAADLSCPTGQDCFAAAADTLPPVRGVSYGYHNPVVEATHDGGRTWAPLSLPVVKPAPLADVYPLSCPSADGCIAGASTVRGKFANGGLIVSSFPGSGDQKPSIGGGRPGFTSGPPGRFRATVAVRPLLCAASGRPLPCGYSQSLRLNTIQSTRAVTGIRTAAAIRPEARLKPGYGTFMP